MTITNPTTPAAPVSTVTEYDVQLAPHTKVYHVEVESKGGSSPGIWEESFGSLEALHAFLRGVHAGRGITGYHDVHVKDWVPGIALIPETKP